MMEYIPFLRWYFHRLTDMLLTTPSFLQQAKLHSQPIFQLQVLKNQLCTSLRLFLDSQRDTLRNIKGELIKCPFIGCKFENIHQEEIDHHYRLTHDTS